MGMIRHVITAAFILPTHKRCCCDMSELNYGLNTVCAVISFIFDPCSKKIMLHFTNCKEKKLELLNNECNKPSLEFLFGQRIFLSFLEVRPSGKWKIFFEDLWKWETRVEYLKWTFCGSLRGQFELLCLQFFFLNLPL